LLSARSLRPDIGARGRRPGVEARQVSCPRRFDPSKSSPRSQPYGVTTACSAPMPLDCTGGGRSSRTPLPGGGGDVVPVKPSTSRRCSENGSVALDTLAGGESLVPSMGLMSPSWPDFLRSLPELLRGDPTASRRTLPSGRPWRRGESLRSSRGHPPQGSARRRPRGSVRRGRCTVRRPG
jgi:hypothetical protein